MKVENVKHNSNGNVIKIEQHYRNLIEQCYRELNKRKKPLL